MPRLHARAGRQNRKSHPQLELLEGRDLLSVIAGPDGFGYTASTAAFENVNLQPGQPGVFTILQAGDDAASSVNLGANTLNFYGKTYTGANALFVSSNGLITFGASYLANRNTDLTTDPVLPTITPLWSDFVNNNLPGNAPMIMGQFQDVNGDGVSDRLIIEWNQIAAWRDITAPSLTFETILQLNTGSNTSSITFNYSKLNPETPSIATAGIKDAGSQGADRILITDNAANSFIGTGLAIQFTAPAFGSTISGQLYGDLNNNGVRDAGEPALAGWTVYLDLNRNGQPDLGDPTTVTDNNGNYSFTNLAAGSYLVQEVAPAGWSQTQPSGTFSSPTVGPEGFGYGAFSTPFQNIDLQSGQSGVFTILQSGDDVSVPVNLGSNTFNFYGVNYTGAASLYVSSNGLISFGQPDIGWTNTDLTTYPPEPAIAPFWSDWFKSGGTPMILGKFVNNQLIIEWSNINTHPASPNPITFQAILHLNTGAHPGDMEFDYPNLVAGNPLVNNGADATVGIENTLAGASDRLLISQNNGSGPLVGTGKAILVSAANGGAYGVAVGFRSTATGNDFGNFHAITAVNDGYHVDENQLLTVVAPGVLSNDTGTVPGAPLTARLVNSVGHGTLAFNSDGSFVYTPAAGFFGTDSFTYTASNGGPNSNVATVTITVDPVASPPTLTTANASGFESTALALVISAAPSDLNIPETVTVQIAGVPTGVSLSAGINSGAGVWLLNASQLQNLTIFSPLPATFSLTVTATATVVSNGRQASSTATLNVAVSNVAPTNLNLSLSAPLIQENDAALLSGTFTDPGIQDTHTVTVSWGDGSASTLQLAAGAVTFNNLSHQYLDNPAGVPSGNYVIQVTVADNFGASTSANTNVTVSNAAPSNITLTPNPTTINENDSTSLSGSFVDPGTLDTHAVVISWGDGGSSTLNLGAGVLTFAGVSHQYLDNLPSGNYVISVTVTDKDGGTTSANTSLAVLNVAPSNLNLALTAGTISENGSTSLGGTFADPGTLDSHTVVINWGDGASSSLNLAAGVLSFGGVTHQYLDVSPTGGFPITVTVTDIDGGATSSMATVTVSNVPPFNLTIALAPTTINENGSTNLSGTFDDPGTLDTHTVVISWGDGGSSTVNLAAGVLSFGVTHQYLDNSPSGSYSISVSVGDNHGGTTGINTSVAVLNVAPANLTLTPIPPTINEKGSTSLSGTFTDPGTLDSHTVVIYWGDGASSSLSLAPGVLSFGGVTHQYLDNSAGGYTISVTVTDSDGGMSSTSTNLGVVNVAPSGLSLALTPSTINENDSTSLSGTFVDPGTLDSHTVVISWGDGGSSTLNLAAGVLSFSPVTHQYLDNSPSGSYSISVTVTDKDGGTTTVATSVAVLNVAPANLALALSASTINENGSTSVSGTFTDPGTLDSRTVVVNWGDGTSSSANLAVGVFSFSGVTHHYLDTPASGSYTIAVTVTDKDGGASSANANLTVINVAPSNFSLALGASAINENDAANLSGAFTDPGTLDTHTVVITWGDGGSSTLNLAAGVLTFSGATHQYLDNPPSGSYLISVILSDKDGASTSASTSVTVSNVAPANLALTLAAATITENDSANLSGTFTDAGTLDTHTVVVTWGDGASSTFNLAAGVLTFSGVTHQYLNNAPSGSFPISVTVTDNDSASTSASASVTVLNVTPSNLVLTLTAATINENDSTSLNGTFTDHGTLDAHTVVVSWGDGGSSTLNLAAGVLSFSGLTHQYLDNSPSGTYSISVTVTDKDGGVTSAATTITVQNAAPANLSLALTSAAIKQGDSTALSGSFTDPGTLDTHTVSIHWGDGSTTTLNLPAGVLSFGGVTHQYVGAAGNYNVAVAVIDKDQGSVTGTTTVSVSAATMQAGVISGPNMGVRGQDLAFLLTPGGAAGSTWNYAIDWNGDGVVDQRVSGGPDLAVDHVYSESGFDCIHVTATNQDGEARTFTPLTVTLTALALQTDPLYPGLQALVVGGTTDNDEILFRAKKDGVQVILNGKDAGTFSPTSRIIAFGQAGNDLIKVSRKIKLPAWLYGGAGNDILRGGGGNNVLLGGEGDDVLIAGRGRDLLIGGSGRNILIGKGGGDILIAGSTAFDNSESALFAIVQEWTSNRDLETRIANLSGTNRSPSFGKRLNGNYFLKVGGPNATVFADAGCQIVLDRDSKDWEVIPVDKDHRHSWSDSGPSRDDQKALLAFWDHVSSGWGKHWQDEWKCLFNLGHRD